MKHDAWRHDPAQYTETFEIQPRYSDVDTLRHLNNSALYGLHQEARQRFLTARIGDGFWRARGPRLRVQRASTDFLLESQYPQPLLAAVRVTALDRQRLTLATGLFQSGRCVGLQSSQLQASERGQPCALPDDWQAALHGALPHTRADAAAVPPVAPVKPVISGGLARFPQHRDLDTRYADLDATGRVSELALMRGAEQGRSVLLREAFATLGADAERAWLGLLVARVDLQVLGPAPMPARWQLGTGVSHLGRSSVVLRVGFFGDDARCAAQADCVLVFVDRQAGKPVAMPDAIRALLGQRRVSE